MLLIESLSLRERRFVSECLARVRHHLLHGAELMEQLHELDDISEKEMHAAIASAKSDLPVASA